MDTRDKVLLSLRPIIESAKVTSNMKEEEIFQNRTLRPVIKLQNDLLIEVFKHYVLKHKNVFYTFSIEKKLDYIENAVQKDMKFRNILKGIVIGQFTCQEYDLYVQNSSAFNKRMMNIVKERLKSNVMLFDQPSFSVS